MLTHATIKRVALRHGLTFDDSACNLLIAESYEGETISEALIDYLNAYEGLSEKTLDAIANDKEARATE